MAVSAEALRELMALGIRGEKLAAVVAIFERQEAQRAEDRPEEPPYKAVDRERSQRYRDNRRANGMNSAFRGDRHRPALEARDGRACVYCVTADGVTVDHMVPISQGGTDDLANLALACTPCNSRKRGRTPEQARMTFGRRSAELAHARYISTTYRPDEIADAGQTMGADANAHIDTTTSSKEPKIKKVRKKTISAPLPIDWKPTPIGRAYAVSKGWDNLRVDAEGERFRDHSLAKGLNHRDVEAAWRNWVTSPYQAANGARASPGVLPRPGSREDRQEKTHNAYQKLRQYAHPQADGPADSDTARDPSFGLLPFPKPA